MPLARDGPHPGWDQNGDYAPCEIYAIDQERPDTNYALVSICMEQLYILDESMKY